MGTIIYRQATLRMIQELPESIRDRPNLTYHVDSTCHNPLAEVILIEIKAS